MAFPVFKGIQVRLGKCPAHAWLSFELGFVVSSTASGNCRPMILRMCSLVSEKNSNHKLEQRIISNQYVTEYDFS